MKLRIKRAIGRAGLASEKRTAELLGGRQTPASGALSAFKGDIRTDKFLVEAKSTARNSLAVKLDWLLKIKGEARETKLKPALTVTFTNVAGDPVPNGEWVLIPLTVFNNMVAELDDAE